MKQGTDKSQLKEKNIQGALVFILQ